MESSIGVFQLSKEDWRPDIRIEGLDMSNDMVCYGDNKGKVYLSRIAIVNSLLIARDTQSKDISKKTIEKVEFLHQSNMIVVLTCGTLYFLDDKKLKIKSNIGKSIITFAVNPFNEQIATAYEKSVSIYSYNSSKEEYETLSLSFGKGNELGVSSSIQRLVWNGEILGIAHKKSFSLINLQEGTSTKTTNTDLLRCLGVFKNSWVAVLENTIRLFDIKGKPSSAISIPKISGVNAMIIQNYYLLLLSDLSVHVFDLIDCKKVQEISISLEKGVIGRALAHAVNKVLIVFDVQQKKDSGSRVLCLRAVATNKLIIQLIRKSRINEAKRIFSQSVPSDDPSFDKQQKQFNLNAGWQLFKDLEFDKASQYLSEVEFDPREFLILIPGLIDNEKHKNLTDLLGGKANEETIKKATMTIIKLVESQRIKLEETYNIEEGKEIIDLIQYSSNEDDKDHKDDKDSTKLSDIIEIIDNSLFKFYLQQGDISMMQKYIESIKSLKCNYEVMSNYLKQYKNSIISKVYESYLEEVKGKYTEALGMWKSLIGTEVNELAYANIKRLLIAKVKNLKNAFEYAKLVIDHDPLEGLNVFKKNVNVGKSVSQNEVLEYLESFKERSAQLKEDYLEHLMLTTEEKHFHTLLGLHYISIIRDSAGSEIADIEVTNNPTVTKYKEKFNKFLNSSILYDGSKLLDSIQKIGFKEEQVLICTKEGKYEQAIATLIEICKTDYNFTRVEEYCLKQPKPLLAALFKQLIDLLTELRKRYNVVDRKDIDYDATRKALNTVIAKVEQYCKRFLIRYFSNEKFDTKAITDMIPLDWNLVEVISGKEDTLLLKYLEFIFNDKIRTVNKLEVAQKIAEMHKLNLDSDLVKLQSAYLHVAPEKKCLMCGNSFDATKSFYVYPNGVLVHSSCIKDLNKCSVTNTDFLKKPY